MFTFIKPDINIDFMGKRLFFAFVSATLLIISLILIFTRGINFGIDFTGGVEIQAKFNSDVDVKDLRLTLTGIKGHDDLQVQRLGEEHNEFLIRFKGEEKDLDSLSASITNIFKEKYGDGSFEILKVDMVGPKVGKELRNSGFYAILYALIGILIYITIRFDFKYSPGAVLCLVHDVIITIGVFSLLQREFSLTTIAALLTIVGYSLNDTVVVFDRIRETVGKTKGVIASSLVNKALNETLSRTTLTSLTTLFVVIALFFFGGLVLRDFALALLIGITIGTYSSIYIASPIMLLMEKYFAKKS